MRPVSERTHSLTLVLQYHLPGGGHGVRLDGGRRHPGARGRVRPVASSPRHRGVPEGEERVSRRVRAAGRCPTYLARLSCSARAWHHRRGGDHALPDPCHPRSGCRRRPHPCRTTAPSLPPSRLRVMSRAGVSEFTVMGFWRSPRTMSSVETDMVCSDGRQEDDDDKEQEDTLFAA